jgi:hypothetical protein
MSDSQRNELAQEEKEIRNDERLKVQRELNAFIRDSELSDHDRKLLTKAKRRIVDGRFRDVE